MLLLSLMALASLALGAAAYAWAACSSRARAVALPLLLALLCGRAVLSYSPALEWRLFPWAGYAYVQGFWLYPIAVVFFGLAAARLPVRWNRVVIALVGLSVLGHGMHRHSWIAWPESHGDARVADANHHLQQSTHYTCGPAACAAALSHCGIQVSERDMASLCLTRTGGTSLFDLYRGIVTALAEQPFAVSIEELPYECLRTGNHVLVCSNSGGGHAICLVAHDGKITVHDPLRKAPQEWIATELPRTYVTTAIVIRERSAP
jgi:hypothetical protein